MSSAAKPVQRTKGATWGKAPLGRVEPKAALPAVQFGASCAVDARYQIDPATFAGGEFARAGIGRYYVAEASCCAARRR